MFLEQLIDLLFWCITWLISEIRCPSKRNEREQQQRSLQVHRNENINVSIQHSEHFPLEHDFEYKEFPEATESECEIEAQRLVSESTLNEIMFNATVEFRFNSWFLPHKSERGPLLKSLARSFLTNITLTLTAIFISVISSILAYFDIETVDKCIGIQPYLNKSLPVNILRWKLIGESFEVVVYNFCFSAAIALLFGWKVFLKKFKSLLYIGLIMGLLAVIYKTFLFIYVGSGFSNSYNRYPANALFSIGIILSCIQIANVLQQSPTSILLKIGQILAFFLFMSWSYRYFIVPWFNDQTSGINKAMIAAILPLSALIPIAVGKYVALCHCSRFVQADASFVLIYFNYLVPVALYRIMQAELKDLRLFVAFSLLHGTFDFLAQVSSHIVMMHLYMHVL